MSFRDRMLADAARTGQRLQEMQDAVVASIAGRPAAVLVTVLASDGRPVSRALEQYEIDALAAAIKPP